MGRSSAVSSESGLLWSRAARAVLIVGVALRLVQWLAKPSLWMDEVLLVRNVRERGLTELLTDGLGYQQVAPVGYLLPAKVSEMVFGDGELALRLVPVGASILALVLFLRLARTLLEPMGALVATTGFSFSPLLISLSSVAKQYSTDVLATVVLLVAFQSLWDIKGSLRSRILVGAGAGVVGLLSIPSVMVSGSAIAGLAVRAWATGALRTRNDAPRALMPLVVWGAVAGASALWAQALLTPRMGEFMTRYWAGVGAFAPAFTQYPTWALDMWSGRILPGLLTLPYIGAGGFMPSLLRTLVGPTVLAGVLLVSVLALAMSGGLGRVVAIVLPFLLALGFSRFEIYPMDVRTSAFLVPLLLLLIGALTCLLCRGACGGLSRIRVAAPLLMVMSFSLVLVNRPPVYVVQRDREVFHELSMRRGDAEPVFADGWARASFAYYGAQFGVGETVHYGDGDLREDLAALHGLRGESSVWILFTNTVKRDHWLCYLDEVGAEVERVVLHGELLNHPVSLHRYDLSDESRWASPSGFPVTEEAFEGVSPRCRRQTWSAAGG